MINGLYRGYSTHQYQQYKTFSVTDVDLVNLDLLNHIFTRRGERVMMPTFGTRIPGLAFEPLDDFTMAILVEDLNQVFTFDPRVQLLNLQVTPDYDANSVTASATLLYIELDMTSTLDINIQYGDTQ